MVNIKCQMLDKNTKQHTQKHMHKGLHIHYVKDLRYLLFNTSEGFIEIFVLTEFIEPSNDF